MVSAAANQYGVPLQIGYGVVQQESSFNPNAAAHTSSAFGFMQLLKGTASDLGVDRFDPNQNLQGGMRYLSQLHDKFGNWSTALAAYHDGPGAVGKHGGFDYASSVLSKGQALLSKGASSLLDTAKNLGFQAGEDALNAVFPGLGSAAGGIAGELGIGGGQDSCFINPICYLRKWIDATGFFERIALVTVGFIMLFAAFYLMKGRE